MLEILIVDDEEDERDVICFLLKKYGFQIKIHTASNGLEALEFLTQHEPDILLTDVQMPFLKGTELAVKARELYPELQILFFSGYDDFSYAKQALSVGAIDYILKPISPEEFHRTMEAAAARIRQHQQAVWEQEKSSLYRKNHILSQLLGGASLQPLKEKYGDIDFSDRYNSMLLLQFDAPVFDREPTDEGADFDGIVEQSLGHNAFHTLNLNPRQALVLLEKEASCSASLQLRRETAETLQQRMSEAYHQPCFLAVSPSFTGLDALASVFSDTERMLEDRFFFPDIYVYPAAEEPSSLTQNPAQDTILLQGVEQALQDQDLRGLRRSLDILFEKYSARQELSQIYVRYLFSQIAETLCRNLPEQHDIQSVIEKIYLCRDLSEIRIQIMELSEKASSAFTVEEDAPHHTIQIVQRYIREHYAEDLSLERLAGVAYLSPRYLSDLFIRQTGCGINKYLKNLRMEKAAQLLLSTNKKVQDICREVGYSNFSYFCRSFREQFGCSPETYRQVSGGVPC